MTDREDSRCFGAWHLTSGLAPSTARPTTTTGKFTVAAAAAASAKGYFRI